MSNELVSVGHDGRVIQVIPGRAFLEITGYTLERVYRMAYDRTSDEIRADWSARRDCWADVCKPYAIVSLTIAEVDALVAQTTQTAA